MFPPAPVMGEWVSPRTFKPIPIIKSYIFCITSLCTIGSLTIPFRPTFSRPASNCGLIRAIIFPPGFNKVLATGSTSVREIKATSITAMSQLSPRSSGLTNLMFVRSMTTTLVSWRSLQSSWPYPTSMAYTFFAPLFKRQSVKPPVEAPISTAVYPVTSTWKSSKAFSSFSPPLPT